MPFVSFFLRDDAFPRTQYWQHFSEAVRRSPSYRAAGGDVLIPEEDFAMETNWPRYGRHQSSYVRGEKHEKEAFAEYFGRIREAARSAPAKTVLFLNMNPFFTASHLTSDLANVIVADVSLTEEQRAENPRTISMPAMPVVKGKPRDLRRRPVLASFQGRNSDPVREELRRASNGGSIVVNFVETNRYIGKVDAIRGQGDPSYEELLAQSSFAFVRRGDSHFSYRLLEVMSFGCIPVILSDGWVLPLDRIVGWEEFSVRVRREEIPSIPELLSGFSSQEIEERQKLALAAYDTFFASFPKVVAALLMEADLVLAEAG